MAIYERIDARSTKKEFLDYDICIIGSGPAGMTLCSELSSTNTRICVLEWGPLTPGKDTPNLHQISTGEIIINDTPSSRVVGGASKLWSGLSAPLDYVDFSLRPYTQEPSSWPITRDELIPFYKRTEHYGFPNYDLYATREKRPSLLEDLSSVLEEKKFCGKDPALDFGTKFLPIFKKTNIDLYTNAYVESLGNTRRESLTTITHANIRNTQGHQVCVRANTFVIATGGIETIGLLLRSRDTSSAGIGNEYDVVGRYIMNHPKNNFGIIELAHEASNLSYFWGSLEKSIAGYSGIRLNDEAQIARKILNSYVRLEPLFPWADNRGVEVLIRIVKNFKFILGIFKKGQKKIMLLDWNEAETEVFKQISGKDLFDLFKNLPTVFQYALHRLSQTKNVGTKHLRVRNFMEMEPLRENRVTLIQQNENSILNIRLNLSDLDKRSLVELHDELKKSLEKQKIGRLIGNLHSTKPWPVNIDARHYLGGARMGNDPKTSVVDKNLRVHSVSNLYILSGSVFPTSGCANPTYTICALAIRLADFLKKYV